MLFLVAIGAGAAVLEVHRALSHNGSQDVKALREKEAELRRQLQDLQRDLHAAQQERALSESEAATLSAVNTRLAAENTNLAEPSSTLRAENEALAARADSLLGAQAALESAAESLRLENCTLLTQFDRLKLRREAEAAGFSEQVAELKAAVAGVLGRFAGGEIDASQLVAFLGSMGVELRCRKEGLEALPEQLNSARSSDERLKLLDSVRVEVQEGWLARMRLATDQPDRAARMLTTARAHHPGSAAGGSNGEAQLALAQGIELGAADEGVGASAQASAAALPYPPPPAKLPTPRERPVATLPKVPPLRLGGLGSGAAPAPLPLPEKASREEDADAGYAADADENSAANSTAMSVGPSGSAAKAAAGKGKKSGGGGIRFLPGKKVAKKVAVPPTAPALELDLPLSARREGGALARLPYDAARDDDLELPGGARGMVAL